MPLVDADGAVQAAADHPARARALAVLGGFPCAREARL